MSTNLAESGRVASPFSAPVVSAPQTASGQALAVREATHIQSAMLLAQQFPRDAAKAMDRILVACTRITLAQEATYAYSRGGNEITGPTIRLAEEIRRNWGNMLSGWEVLNRGENFSEVRTYCWDLEARSCEERKFIVKHWRDTRSGGYALTDERDIYETVANLAARRERACILASIPGDVILAAVEQCEVTLKAKVDVTPERINSMIEKFAGYGVTPEMIEKRLQRRIDTMTPAGFVQLGKVFVALRDGMGKVSDYFQAPVADTGSAPDDGKGSAADQVKARLQERQQAQQAGARSSKREPPKGKPPEDKKAGKDGAGESELPFYSSDKALMELRGAGTIQAVCETWAEICADFNNSDRLVTPEIVKALPVALAAVSIAELRAAKTPEDLQRVWKESVKAHQANDLAMPIEVEAIHNECREVLEEKGTEP